MLKSEFFEGACSGTAADLCMTEIVTRKLVQTAGMNFFRDANSEDSQKSGSGSFFCGMFPDSVASSSSYWDIYLHRDQKLCNYHVGSFNVLCKYFESSSQELTLDQGIEEFLMYLLI